MANVSYSAPPDLRWDAAAREWVVLREFRVNWSDGRRQLGSFHVAAGFSTDLASIPRAFLWLIPKMGRHLQPAIVHDWCYEAKTRLTRAQADRLFLDGMRAIGVPQWKRALMYSAVRLFGRGKWD